MSRIPDLMGGRVVLTELNPKFFQEVVSWRNDEQLNKFLNQSQKLTIESEDSWYRQSYLNDDTQGLMIFLDKSNSVPFATLGWTDLDKKERRCILGRLILGNPQYRNHAGFLEGFFLLSDYLYQYVDVMYIHLAMENKKAVRLNQMLGFVPNQNEMQYPHEARVNGIPQHEYYRTREMYRQVRKKLYEDLQESLF